MKVLRKITQNSINRFDLWAMFLKYYKCHQILEIGVYKGEFAEFILNNCIDIKEYHMLDPWRNLENWNKPANASDEQFETYYKETLKKTDQFSSKRIIYRGKTTEVINDVADNSIDFAYIDGDHTLKGITIDLTNVWDKIKIGGFVAGDDFCKSIWQHENLYEPTFVFPYAVYFAEAKSSKIYSLPYNQFLIVKGSDNFEFIDFTAENYSDFSILNQILPSGKKRNNGISSFLKRF